MQSIRLKLSLLRHVAGRLLKLKQRHGLRYGTTYAAYKKLRAANAPLFGRKAMKHGKHWYWNMYAPGYPSATLDIALDGELATAAGTGPTKVHTIIYAMTDKCGLQCQHCFEWPNLNQDNPIEEQAMADLLGQMIDQHQPTQVFLSGGEPFAQFEVLQQLVQAYSSHKVNFWVITSGSGVTARRLKLLKAAGLTGMVVSLDHYDEQAHNAFRGHGKSYGQATAAVRLAVQTGLVTALSLCPQRGKVNRKFMEAYAALARQLQVQFIQLMEPRAEGRYAQQEVTLTTEEQQVLEAFAHDLQTKSRYTGYPLVAYPDYNRRQLGCQGGKRFVYVNTKGKVQPCAFCAHEYGSMACQAHVTNPAEALFETAP